VARRLYASAVPARALLSFVFAIAALAVWGGPRRVAADQPAGRPIFEDVAQAAGLTHRTVFGGTDKNTYILETTGKHKKVFKKKR